MITNSVYTGQPQLQPPRLQGYTPFPNPFVIHLLPGGLRHQGDRVSLNFVDISPAELAVNPQCSSGFHTKVCPAVVTCTTAPAQGINIAFPSRNTSYIVCIHKNTGASERKARQPRTTRLCYGHAYLAGDSFRLGRQGQPAENIRKYASAGADWRPFCYGRAAARYTREVRGVRGPTRPLPPTAAPSCPPPPRMSILTHLLQIRWVWPGLRGDSRGQRRSMRRMKCPREDVNCQPRARI